MKLAGSGSGFQTRDFELEPWQQQAVEAWWRGDDAGPHRGTLEIFTGGGKTLIALAAAERAYSESPDLRVAVVVPTEALARQWRDVIRRRTWIIERGAVGLLGAGRKDTFDGRQVLVCVLASAAKRLPELAESAQPLMLIVDECHRAGAPKMSRVLDTPAEYRLGLSATPDREELGEDGEPIDYDEHVLGQKLGKVVYRFSLKDARESGWLPSYEIHHHGIHLLPDERKEYEALSREVDDAETRLERLGVDKFQARSNQGKGGDLGRAAQAYVAATSKRKDLLYRARERTRIAERLVTDEAALRERPRTLLFHERVAEAEQLYRALQDAVGPDLVGLEHSKLGVRQREQVLDAFRSGERPILVSVKSLIEGVDVPDADVGVSVASTSSVRQRIQSLGRVLRRGEPGKHATMHVIYVADTVDDFIYEREDWSDLTGSDVNRYYLWPTDPEAPPELQDGPPRKPRPTEEQEWERLGRRTPDKPVPYEGAIPFREYSVDAQGNVRNSFGSLVSNPQGTAEMVAAVRGRPGGRFYVTPLHRMVLVIDPARGKQVFVAGVVPEPFATRDLSEPTAEGPVDVDPLSPGDPYPGAADSELGSYAISQRDKGSVERRVGRVRQFAFTSGTDHPDLEQNARRVIDAWRVLGAAGMKFSVNGLGHAWYLAGGEPRFLASVPGGFAFPDPPQGSEGERDGRESESVPRQHAAPGSEGGEVPHQT